jgi:hypothetical protein
MTLSGYINGLLAYFFGLTGPCEVWWMYALKTCHLQWSDLPSALARWYVDYILAFIVEALIAAVFFPYGNPVVVALCVAQSLTLLWAGRRRFRVWRFGSRETEGDR